MQNKLPTMHLHHEVVDAFAPQCMIEIYQIEQTITIDSYNDSKILKPRPNRIPHPQQQIVAL